MWPLLACAGPADDTALQCSAPPELSVRSYNVHGLPPAITGDDTPGRVGAIGPLVAPWNMVGLQEDWIAENHTVLADGAGHAVRRWFDATLDGRVYGAGLSQFTSLLADTYLEEHYTACSGTFDGASSSQRPGSRMRAGPSGAQSPATSTESSIGMVVGSISRPRRGRVRPASWTLQA